MTRTLTIVILAVVSAAFLTSCTNDPEAESDPAAVASATAAATTTPPTTSPAALTEYDQYVKLMKDRRIPIRPGSSGTYYSDVSICGQLRDGSLDTWNLADREGVREQDVNGLRITVMVPLLCPDMQPAIDAARFGELRQTTHLGGKALVSQKPIEGSRTVQPGTWTTETAVSDCYWERSDAQGNIIDNNFVSIAPPITVVIAESDSGFTSNDCGKWTRTG